VQELGGGGRGVVNYRIAIVGAAGLVGQELLSILEQRNFPISSVQVYSSDGVGGTVLGNRRAYTVQLIDHTNEHSAFRETDLAFFVAGDDASRHLAPQAVRSGATVIDSSSVYRPDAEIPLVVPEINPEDIEQHRGIIASPCCSTIILDMVLYPLHKINPIKRAVVSTYQSVSGLGSPGMNELSRQTQQILAGETPRPQIFPHEIGFNIIPQVDVFLDTGYTKEEWQMLDETRKILHNNDILVSATCVRVPTFKGHCQAITVEFTDPINEDTAGDILSEAPGIRVMNDTTIGLYPQPRVAAGTDAVLVGRIRQEAFNTNGLVLWTAADNVRKGAALNMVQIAEEINKKGWLKAKGQR
jgi:aspartate-semialdehyde dehydrogenase